jgi:hypothetical protein
VSIGKDPWIDGITAEGQCTPHIPKSAHDSHFTSHGPDEMAGFSVVPLRSLPPPRGHRALPGSQPRRSLAISIPRASSVPALSVRFPSLHALASAWTRFLACPAGGGTAPSQSIVCRNTEPLVHSYQVAASVWPFGPLEMGDAFPGTGQPWGPVGCTSSTFYIRPPSPDTPTVS